MSKVIVIGLDAVNWYVLKTLFKWNCMPFLKNYLQKAIVGQLISTIPPDTPPAWTSMFTGKNPGKHGVYGFFHCNPIFNEKSEDYEFRLVNSNDIKAKRLWDIVSENGMRNIVINAPLTYPPKKLNGLLISGFMTPNLKSNFTYPLWLKYLILKRGYNLGVVYGQKKYTPLELINSIRIKKHIIKFLLKKYSWDLAISVFMETDQVMHKYWGNREVMKMVFGEIDLAIKEILRDLPKDVVVIIVSDHGFKEYRGTIYINRILWKLGFLKIKYRKLLKFLFYKLRNSIKNISTFDIIQFNKSIAYAILSSTNCTGLLLNLMKRDPKGIVKEEEIDNIIERLYKELAKICHRFNEEIINIYSKDDIYWGPFLENAPDYIIKTKNNYRFSTALNIRMLEEKITSTHSSKGIFIIRHPDIGYERLNLNPKIWDIAPTILRILNVKTPNDMDGQPIVSN